MKNKIRPSATLRAIPIELKNLPNNDDSSGGFCFKGMLYFYQNYAVLANFCIFS